MDKSRIYPVLDYILNHADADDLAAIREALKRREEQRGFGGVDLKNVAKETSRGIEGQIGGSLDSIRDMIRKFAVEMIVKESPDIPEEHLKKLIEAWIPTAGRHIYQRGNRNTRGCFNGDDSAVYCCRYRTNSGEREKSSGKRVRRLGRDLLEPLSCSCT